MHYIHSSHDVTTWLAAVSLEDDVAVIGLKATYERHDF